MSTRTTRFVTSHFLIACAVLVQASPASAQTPTERAALSRALRAGHPVVIEVASPGPRLFGQLTAVDTDAIELVRGSDRRRLSFAEVDRIYKEGDSVLNGVAIGATIAGGICVFVCAGIVPSAGDHVNLILRMSAFGAVVGGFIDSERHGTTTLYQRPTRLRVGGMISPRGVGVGATLRW